MCVYRYVRTCSLAFCTLPTVVTICVGFSSRTHACSSGKELCSEYGTSCIRNGPARRVRPDALPPADEVDAHLA